MLTTDATVTFQRPNGMNAGVAKRIQRTLDTKIKELGFVGIWVSGGISPRHSKVDFEVLGYENQTGTQPSSITVVVRPTSDNRSAWECYITPPADYVIDDVVAMLMGQPIGRAAELVEEEPVTIKSSNAQLEIGHTFDGKVIGVQSYGVFVELCAGVVGLVHISEWDHKHINNISDETSVDDIVRVMLIKITEDGKLSLSRRSALEVPDDVVVSAKHEMDTFTGKCDDLGNLQLRGFARDMDNLIWFLSVLPKNHDNLVTTSLSEPVWEHPEYYDAKLSVAAWKQALLERYKAKNVQTPRFGPIIKTLIVKELIVKVMPHRRPPLGYMITEIGWREIGGRSKFGISQSITERESRLTQSDAQPQPMRIFNEDKPVLAEVTEVEGLDIIPNSFALLVTLKEKTKRLSEITDTLTELQTEKKEIGEWIDNHPDAVIQYKEAQRRREELGAEIANLDKLLTDE